MSRVIPYVMRPERQREVRYVPPKTPPSPGPATRSPGGPLRGRAAAPPGQPGAHSPKPCFAASITGKNQYVRPRAPCTSAPPHADGEEWGGLDRDMFSRAAAARCLGSSEGCPARPVVSLRVDGRPIPTALHHRHVLERLWSERGGRRPPWDLLRLPALRRICREPRRPKTNLLLDIYLYCAGRRRPGPGPIYYPRRREVRSIIIYYIIYKYIYICMW